jgi:two-component system OmpR family sensor kinase
MKRLRLPIRTRLTLAFALAMAVVLATLGGFLYLRLGADLMHGIDMDLRARAEVVSAAARERDASVIRARGSLIDPDEAFAQILDASGRIVETSPAVAAAAMLTPAELRAISAPRFFTARVHGVDDPVRLLAVPVSPEGAPMIVVAGATLGDRNEALGRLLLLLAIGGPLALGLVSWGGWVLAGAALRPVERMRSEAAAISASEPDHRLPVPPTNDELSRLASTLNSMLDRVQEAADRDRRFVDRASHELRTPLTVLKTEVDLALARPRSGPELEAALRGASVETDRLVRLAEDLLVFGRLKDGALPVHRSDVDLGPLLLQICAAWKATSEASGVRLVCAVSPHRVRADPIRLRQAVENLLDNAIRYGGGGAVEVRAESSDGFATIAVLDRGPGFPGELLARRPGNGHLAAGPTGGLGIGLWVAGGIAEAHGGELRLANRARGGARASVVLPV